MRQMYDEQLRDLRAGLADVCALTKPAITQATRALLDEDLTAAEHVVGLSDEIAQHADDLEKQVFSLIALQAPVARDLRAVIAGLHIVENLRRMGTLAVHIAEVAQLVHPESALPEKVRPIFVQMGTAARDQVEIAHDVLRTGDTERAGELNRVDDQADRLLSEVFTATRSPEWPHGAAAAVNATLLGRYYERFCDHTVEIGRHVIFVNTGTLPDWDSTDADRAR